MRSPPGNGIIQLAADGPLALRGARNAELECVEGAVWLTLEGEPQDYLLAAGERMRLARGGLALVEGNPVGAIRLIRATPRWIAWASALLRRFEPRAPLPRIARTLDVSKPS